MLSICACVRLQVTGADKAQTGGGGDGSLLHFAFCIALHCSALHCIVTESALPAWLFVNMTGQT
jgi:hypothetical protein